MPEHARPSATARPTATRPTPAGPAATRPGTTDHHHDRQDRHDRAPGFATEQVHGGEAPEDGFGARVTPVHLTAGFVFDSFAHARARFAGEDDGYTYTRIGNPTVAALERRLARLEGGAEAVVVGSGQAAVTVALLGLLQAGDHLLAASTIYEGSRGLFLENFARFGIEVDLVEDPTDLDAWRALVRPTTRALFGESISNPTNVVLDVAGVAGVAHEAGVPLVVDSTLATPYLLRPLEHGADVVVHSASKFLAGHGASLGGALVVAEHVVADPRLFAHLVEPSALLGGRSWTDVHGSRAYVAYARAVIASRLGPTISPLNAFLVQQGLQTLSLRLRQHCAGALAVAGWLAARPEVASVRYAGLPGDPSADLAARYLPRGAGSVLCVTLHGGEAAAERFVDGVRLFSRMTHLGDVRSLVLHPASTTHAHRDPAELAAAGIHPGTVRLSIGTEEPEDLLADLEGALAAVRGEPLPPARPALGTADGTDELDELDEADGAGWPDGSRWADAAHLSGLVGALA
ncbi:O-acetylhomoserine aminocarboxypropyltransferase/cysteine synthase family protein [Aquipuribacter hungaricus]|uniref:O-acetylhomoserine aminocarboxypropyltransferase/cysteine synthase family protein n=1 Tax=Aquipuribacter hungaricus TaxID=545624 RepID=A0ABV7WM74_9MICO